MDRVGKILEQQYPGTNRGHSGWAEPLDQRLRTPVRRSLLLLLGAVVFVLLIACVNVANILLAKAAGRRREMAVRAAVGAGRSRLAGQMVTESVVLAALGGIAGLAVAWWGIALLRALAPEGVPLVGLPHMGLDLRVVAFAAALSLATGIIFGFLPAWHLAGPRSSSRAAPGERGARGYLGCGRVECHRGLDVVVGAQALDRGLEPQAGLGVFHVAPLQVLAELQQLAFGVGPRPTDLLELPARGRGALGLRPGGRCASASAARRRARSATSSRVADRLGSRCRAVPTPAGGCSASARRSGSRRDGRRPRGAGARARGAARRAGPPAGRAHAVATRPWWRARRARAAPGHATRTATALPRLPLRAPGTRTSSAATCSTSWRALVVQRRPLGADRRDLDLALRRVRRRPGPAPARAPSSSWTARRSASAASASVAPGLLRPRRGRPPTRRRRARGRRVPRSARCCASSNAAARCREGVAPEAPRTTPAEAVARARHHGERRGRAARARARSTSRPR